MRIALLCLCLFLFGRAAMAETAHTTQTAASEAIMIDAETGTVLFEKDADKTFAPASMAKVMTLAVLFKKLKAGEITLDSKFPVSEHAWRTGGAPSRTTSMFIPLNATASVKDLIQGIAVQNANDACIAVAEALSGSEDAFAEEMTKEARAMGLEKSSFANSTGLPHPGNLVTARELARLTIHVIEKYPEFYPYFAQRDFRYVDPRNKTYNFINLNPILAAYPAADGLKVGFTEGAGYGAVASAVKDGHRIVMVANGFDSEKQRKEETAKLLNWGFANFKSYKVLSSGDVVGEARVWGASKWNVTLKTGADVKILLPVNAKDQRLKGEIVYKGPLKLPIKEGDKVAELRITSQSGTSNRVPLYAAETMEPGDVVDKGMNALALMARHWLHDLIKASVAHRG